MAHQLPLLNAGRLAWVAAVLIVIRVVGSGSRATMAGTVRVLIKLESASVMQFERRRRCRRCSPIFGRGEGTDNYPEETERV